MGVPTRPWALTITRNWPGLMEAPAQRSGVPVPTFVHAFGPHLFGQFYALYSDCFSGIPTALDFLEGIEAVIHTKVRKLYPDAQLPEFDCVRTASGLDMVYSLTRHDLPNGSMRFEMH